MPGGVLGGFTTRTGGASSGAYASLNLGLHVGDDPDGVRRNRALLAQAAGLPSASVVFAEQVHGPGVRVVEGPSAGPVAGVDGLVTARTGLALVVLAADCLPVLLADPVAGVVAAVHAGRAGLVAGVLQAGLAAMSELGAAVQDTVAVIGPAACGGCYELPAELADEVEQAVPGSRATTRAGTASVDLTAGATGLLRSAGLRAVTAVGGCTLEQPDRFFSYRRDGVTGRHAGLVRLG